MTPATPDFTEIARRVNQKLAETWPANLTSPQFTPEDIGLVLSGEGITGVADLIRAVAREVEEERGK